MSDRAYRCERILENDLPFQTIEDATYKMALSVADAFLGNIEFGKDYIIRTERINEGWNGFATKYTYTIKFDEIVRCMDCKYYGCYDGSTWCSRTYEQVVSGTCDYQTVEPDGFCAWGVRADA